MSSQFSGNTWLVTGGAGFIGGTFVRRVLAAGRIRVINLDKLTYAGNIESLEEVLNHPRHIFVQGDINDREVVGTLLKRYRPTAVINFAAESHVDRSIDGPTEFLHTNVVGTFNLISSALAYWRKLDADDAADFRYLQVSTDEVYGSLGDSGKFIESTPYSPNSPYSASKAAADHFVRAFHHTYGLPTLITNCSNNYGPYQFPEKLIPLMILNAFEGKPLPVYGDGQHVRDWLYVDDHCEAICRVLEGGRPGQVYNIGGNCEQTNLNLVQSLCSTIDELAPALSHRPCSSLVTFVADRPGHDRRYAIDVGKIQRELGWQPTTTFDAGLRRTVQWYIDHRDWVDRVTNGTYRRERLGLTRQAA
jgi:dTDP-glucose 4,6-dehydratase